MTQSSSETWVAREWTLTLYRRLKGIVDSVTGHIHHVRDVARSILYVYVRSTDSRAKDTAYLSLTGSINLNEIQTISAWFDLNQIVKYVPE